MSLYKRGTKWWTMFVEDRVLYRKPLKAKNKREALKLERDLIEEARSGSLTAKTVGPKTLFAAADGYLKSLEGRTSARTRELETERLAIVKRFWGDVPLSAITAASITKYQNARLRGEVADLEGGKLKKASGRTINMDVAALRRVMKHCKRWRALEEHVKFLRAPESMIGRALTGQEQKDLLEAGASNPEWDYMHCAAVVALNTTMRRVEVTNLRRQDIDLFAKTVTVGKSKNEAGRRRIPLNAEAIKAFARMTERADLLGFTSPDHYLWFACRWHKLDPTKPMKKWDTAWRAIRKKANLSIRFHDLRHTAITELAEMGTPDSVLKAIAGHITQRMLDHYSHIRMNAKRQALDGLEAFRAEDVLRSLSHVAEKVQ